MKNRCRLFLPLLLGSLLAVAIPSCAENGSKELERERLARAEAQQAAQQSNEAWRTAEAAREREAQGKETWQAVAWIAAAGGVVLLIGGTMLGSRARKDAECNHEPST